MSRTKGRAERTTSQLLRDLRGLRVAVLHPKDQDGELLTQQVQRIGCLVQVFWPPPAELPGHVDIVFCAIVPDFLDIGKCWHRRDTAPAVIAVINYENPTIVDAVLGLGAQGVITAPVRSSGILSAIVVARRLSNDANEARQRVVRLEQKLLAVNKVNQAKLILMKQHGIGQEEAYRIIREQAMAKRVATEHIAAAIIDANELLGSPRR